MQDIIPIEALAVATVLDVLMDNINEEIILNNMRNFSTYHRQCDLVSKALREAYPLMDNSTQNGLHVMDNCVGAVAAIFTPPLLVLLIQP